MDAWEATVLSYRACRPRRAICGSHRVGRHYNPCHEGNYAIPDILGRRNRTGLSGYAVCGSTGESVSLTTEEKIQLWEWVAQYAAPEKLLIAGTGAESVRETVALGKSDGAAVRK